MNRSAQGASRVAVIHANDGTDIRVGKTCRSLMRLGFDTHFIGWDRRPGTAKHPELGGAVQHILQHPTRHGRVSVAGQLSFFRHAGRTLRRIRAGTVCAVNEELAFALLPLRGFAYRQLVCDIYDALGARSSGYPLPLRLLLQAAGEIARRGADRLIVTDEHRRKMLGGFADKAVVVENLPEDPGGHLALQLPTGPTRIWAAGSLDEAHGLRQLLEAVEPLEDVRIVSAGWTYDAFAEEVFVKHPRVSFEGIVSAARALELAAGCDAVFAYYAPIHEYMTNASPNKLNDALAVGRPVLINSEVRLAEFVATHGLGSACPYDDVAGLRTAIAALRGRRAELACYARRARRLFTERSSWAQMESRLKALYSELAGQP